MAAVAVLALAGNSEANAISLGTAANYAVLGVGGAVNFSDFEVYQSGTVVKGNVGMGPHSELTHNIDATITGNFDYDLTSTLNGKSTSGVQGSVRQIDMSGVVADARNASTTAAGLAPTQTFATLSEGQTIVGGAGLNVIRVTGDVSIKTALTIQGPSNSEFVFQFTSPTADGSDVLNLSGMTMMLTGGLDVRNLTWDLNGLGGGININAGSIVYGNFLAPDRDILGDHANVLKGRLIGGGSGNLLSLHSTSFVTASEGGSTFLMLSMGIGMLAAAKRRFLP